MRALALLALTLSACGGEELYVDAPVTTAGRFASPSKLMAFLDGKTLNMSGARIPSHPNGYDEDLNFGQATQCYKQVTMRPGSGRVQVVSELGTLNGAPMAGDRGECDHGSLSAQLTFDSTAVLIENVKEDGSCFDFTITYPGFGQEGRGSVDAEGTTLVLELFFKDQATGHRCAAGEVGAPTVTLSQRMFTGDARQTYTIE